MKTSALFRSTLFGLLALPLALSAQVEAAAPWRDRKAPGW